MEYAEAILSIAKSIYKLCEEVKANKHSCRRVSDRVQTLSRLVKQVQQRGRDQGDEGGISAEVDQVLKELVGTLESAAELVKKYNKSDWKKRILKVSSHSDDFNIVNERLDRAIQALQTFLQVEQGDLLCKIHKHQEEDRQARKEDDAELVKSLTELMKNMDVKKDAEELKNMNKILETIKKPDTVSQDIREIRPQDLKYDFPKKPVFKTSNTEVFKGEYHGFTVAIKRYIDPLSTSPQAVRGIFSREVETMKRFESPNILRMFGICVEDEKGPDPQYFIIMEYCELGSLREVLDNLSCELSWKQRARMSLGAAQALYRLHQTEEKAKVHGCINSNKFLVAEGFVVKLGGLELAKTETSLRKKSSEKSKISSLCYSSPQQLSNLNLTYNIQCEMYSFGIVLWEIATRKMPFEGCKNPEILEKVCEGFKEPLPADCPESLGELIDACRAVQPFHRPTAGVLMDNLRKVMLKLED